MRAIFLGSTFESHASGSNTSMTPVQSPFALLSQYPSGPPAFSFQAVSSPLLLDGGGIYLCENPGRACWLSRGSLWRRCRRIERHAISMMHCFRRRICLNKTQFLLEELIFQVNSAGRRGYTVTRYEMHELKGQRDSSRGGRGTFHDHV